MRARFTLLAALTLIATVFSVGSGASAASSAVGHRSPLVHRGTPITNTTAGAGTQIDRVDMITSSFGYGVAANDTFYPTKWVYLVRTSDAGTSWRMQDALPYLAFHQSGEEVVPFIDFVSRMVGYVSSGDDVPGALFVTTNGGNTWSKIVTPGVTPTFLATASALAVVSDVCVHPHQDTDFNRCPNDLSLYRIGATTPWRTELIPRTSNVANAELFAAPSPNTFVISQGDPGGGGQHSRLSLSETSDAGLTWRRLDDPCATVGSDQLVTYSVQRWILSCFLGEGMNQGIGNTWRTSDGGASWTRILHGDTEASTLVLSGNRRIIFSEVAGATGGVDYSTDGGAKWNRTVIDGEGGAPESLSTIGPLGAIDDVIGGLTYRTLNGRTWTALPELIAGRYRGLSICTARGGVTATLRWKPLRAAVGPSAVIFTNRGTRNCYLDDAPIVQTVDGASRAPVGPPAGSNYTGRPDFVILKAHGGQANAALLVFSASSYSPSSTCRAEVATGLTIAFGAPSSFYDRLRAPTKICTEFSTLNVNVVLAGTNTHT
jgi:photosystem II stability/assembly factor-like uncharacterized protein